MTSLGSLEGLAARPSSLGEDAGIKAAAWAAEAPLALFVGANHLAYLFTTERFLVLRRAQPLARALAGRKLIAFEGAPAGLSLPEIFSLASVKAEVPLADISYLEAERICRAGAVSVYAQGRKHTLSVGHKCAEVASGVEALRARLGIPRSAAGLVMRRELKSWTLLSMLTGVASLLLSFVFPGMLDPIWGLTLVLIGAGILCSAEPAMFIILGVGMAWAALLNLLGLTPSPLRGGRLGLAPMFQIYWAVMLFAKYRKYEHLYDGWLDGRAGTETSGRSRGRAWDRARRLAAGLLRWRQSSARVAERATMPLLSLGIAALEVMLLLSLYQASLLAWPRQVIALLSHGHLHLAMVGAAVGLASLCSRRGARWAAVTGVTVNALMAATIVSLFVTGLLHE